MIIQNNSGSALERMNWIENVTSALVYTTPTLETVYGETTGWILTVESILIILTNLPVAIALLLLICRKGSQSWWFVLNLAVADILVGVAITGIASATVKNRVISMHKEECLLRMAFVITPSAASILSMFFISVDRYVAIKLPLRYPDVMGTKMIAGTLFGLWMLSTLVGFLSNIVEEMQHSGYESICTFFSVIRPQGIIVIFCVVFFPILLVFTFFYLDILKIAWSHQQRIEQSMQVQSRRYWRHVKALRTVCVLVGCFTLCWCPFFVVSIVQVLCPSCKLYSLLESYLWMLGLSNSLINPLVYAFWQSEVRQQLGQIVACLKVGQCCIKPSNRAEGQVDRMVT